LQLSKKMERVKRQATAIADSEDITEKQKQNQITKLYKSKLHTVNLSHPFHSEVFFFKRPCEWVWGPKNSTHPFVVVLLFVFSFFFLFSFTEKG